MNRSFVRAPFVSAYLLGNGHFSARRSLSHYLRHVIHPNTVLDNLSRPGGMLDWYFMKTIKEVVDNERNYVTNRDSYAIIMNFDDDLKTHVDPEELGRSTLVTLKQAALQVPQLNFIIVGCVPLPTVPDESIKKLDAVFAKGCEMLKIENFGFYFISSREILQEFRLDAAFTADDFHLTNMANRKLAQTIAEMINPLIHAQFECNPPPLNSNFKGVHGQEGHVAQIRRATYHGQFNQYLENYMNATINICGIPLHMQKYGIGPEGTVGFNYKFNPSLVFSYVQGKIVTHAQRDRIPLVEMAAELDGYGNPLCLCNSAIDCYPCLEKGTLGAAREGNPPEMGPTVTPVETVMEAEGNEAGRNLTEGPRGNPGRTQSANPEDVLDEVASILRDYPEAVPLEDLFTPLPSLSDSENGRSDSESERE